MVNRIANQQHLHQFRHSKETWNQWKKEHADLQPDLSGNDLIKAFLGRADLSRTDLSKANLQGTLLQGTFLSEADFSNTDLSKANLNGASLNGTNLSRTNLQEADLSGADLGEKNLSGADLTRTILIKTKLEHANLTGCAIHGISVWNVQLRDASQSNLIITEKDEPTITVDNLDVAQFIYLLLKNENIRHVIDTITYKVVLILGRVTPERKAIWIL